MLPSFSRQHLLPTALAVLICAFVGDQIVMAEGSDEERQRVVKPNYQQAAQYSSSYIRQFLYDTSVRPNWIGETDRFYYSFRDSKGTHYYLVDPAKATKEPLFDSVKLAAQLSEVIRKPLDPAQLRFSRLQVNDEGTTVSFTMENKRFEYDLSTEVLSEAERSDSNDGESTQDLRNLSQEQRERIIRERQRSSSSSRSGQHRSFSPDRKSYVFARGHNLYFVEIPEGYEPPKDSDDEDKAGEEGENQDGEDQQEDQGDKDSDQEQEEKNNTDDQQTDDSTSDDQQTGDSDKQQDNDDSDDNKNDDQSDDQSDKDGGDDSGDDQKTDDSQVEKSTDDAEGQDENKSDDGEQDDNDNDNDNDNQDGDEQKEQDKEEDKDEDKDDSDDDESDEDESSEDDEEKEIPIPEIGPELDDTAIQITTDGVEDYSFAGRTSSRSRSGSRQSTPIEDDTLTRPFVSWSDDSKYFYTTRRDSRGVQELWVINSLSDPRPTLEKYDYPMPGEEHIRTSELFTFNREQKELTRVKPEWVDESYTNLQWRDESSELRFIRRDRLLRNVQLCSLDLSTGKETCIFGEGFENAHIAPQSVRYLDDSDEFIWWSERSGWGHFYLYSNDGTLKNAITSGQFRASRIVDVDQENRLMYFTGNSREEGENVYLNHLYCVRLDGTGLKLLDPGNANHESRLSPTKQFIVDNCSRVDMQPLSVLRDADGNIILELETADLSRLEQIGWQMPETFTVKAADGVTDLYGNMWKPFDFDPSRRYPIIAHVYPGPQTEGTRHTFTATAGEQQLAQLGFVVIQVGHRGGTPTRSKAYGSYGYFNLRDYGLADKKAAIEQLAQRFGYIDVERVGIYGHSGGGFMTAAALLREPYNDFFKVGVSTAGNHDNNIYNNSWSERYHGLKQVEVEEEKESEQGNRSGRSRDGDSQQRQQGGNTRSTESAFDVEASDYFFEYELLNGQDIDALDRWHDEAWWDESLLPRYEMLQDDQKQEQEQQKDEENKDEQDKDEQDKDDTDEEVVDEEKDGDDQEQKQEDSTEKDGDEEEKDNQDEKEEDEDELAKTRFEIEVPTNAELAENLKGHLFLIHGEADNNVHPANTLRLVDALIKADKRFDMLYLPATRHSFGQYQSYVTQRMYEYFAEHLLDDYQSGADITEKAR